MNDEERNAIKRAIKLLGTDYPQMAKAGLERLLEKKAELARSSMD